MPPVRYERTPIEATVLPAEVFTEPNETCPPISDIVLPAGRIAINAGEVSPEHLRVVTLNALGWTDKRVAGLGIPGLTIDKVKLLHEQTRKDFDAQSRPHLMSKFFDEVYDVREFMTPFNLEPRERDVLNMHSRGYSLIAIADQITRQSQRPKPYSLESVRDWNSSILKNMNVSSITSAVFLGHVAQMLPDDEFHLKPKPSEPKKVPEPEQALELPPELEASPDTPTRPIPEDFREWTIEEWVRKFANPRQD